MLRDAVCGGVRTIHMQKVDTCHLHGTHHQGAPIPGTASVAVHAEEGLMVLQTDAGEAI